MRVASLFLVLALSPVAAIAQSIEAPVRSAERPDRWRATVTIFRSPGTGVQLSKGHLATFIAHYPTIIKRGGENRNTNFIRVGAAYYLAPYASTSPYVSVSFAPSITKGWSNSAIADVGVRRNFTDRYSGQLGVALLHAPQTNQTRVNPTIGLGVRF